MAEVKTLYQEAPNYTEVKSAQLSPTYEIKSFKSYQRVTPVTGERHVTSDDVDTGGGYDEDA